MNSKTLPRKLLVPDLVTVLTAAPSDVRICAGNALVSTLNS